MKKNWLKKVVAFGVSFCMPMSLTTSVFAYGNNKPAHMKGSASGPVYIKYCVRNEGVRYLIGGINSDELTENDFSCKFIGETKISKLNDGSISVYNPCCNVKVMFIVAALYAYGYDEAGIIVQLDNFIDKFSVKDISKDDVSTIIKKLRITLGMA